MFLCLFLSEFFLVIQNGLENSSNFTFSALELSNWATYCSLDAFLFAQDFNAETANITDLWAFDSYPIQVFGRMYLFLNHESFSYAKLKKGVGSFLPYFASYSHSFSCCSRSHSSYGSASASLSSFFASVCACVFLSDFCSFRAFLSRTFERCSPFGLALDVFALQLLLHTLLEFRHVFFTKASYDDECF